MSRSSRGIFVVFCFLLLSIFSTTAFAAERAHPRVIIVGFDGADSTYVQKWMNEGKLPNLAKLREEGTYRSLLPTTPAQTPVSWSTFSTGICPGRTGIFDFLRRDPKTYLPLFAAFDESSAPFWLGKNNAWAGAGIAGLLAFLIALGVLKLVKMKTAIASIVALVVAVGAGIGGKIWTEKNIPTHRPTVINRRQGIPMWDVAAKAGLKTRVYRIPVTFPAPDVPEGHLMSGLGVPDISARIGKPFFFTSELDLSHYGEGGETNQFSVDVNQLEDNRGTIHTKIVGPPNKLFAKPPYISIPMTIKVADDRESLQITVSGQTFTMKPGEWSNWVEFVFPFSDVVKVHGISRFHLFSIKPEIKLYLSPINFDPRSLPPGFKITSPANWAPSLAKQFGPFKTIGWAIDTWGISEGFANEQTFWDDMTFTVAKSRRMFTSFLKDDDDLLVFYFEFTDRVGHVFWRLMDPQHPAYDPKLAAKWGDALLRSYEMMDDIVGEAMKAAQQQHAVLIVLSDHGFSTWRRSINYDTWLVQNGYMTLKTGVRTKARNLEILFDHGEFWENVDWSKTRAYAMGLGDLYINLKGREAHGIVNPGPEYDQLKKELEAKLVQIVDPKTGEHPVSRVVSRDDVYSAFDPNTIPDLFILNNVGYRVSWQTSLGGVQKDLLEDNKGVWSGDHCSLDPRLVKGIFFYNRKLKTDHQVYVGDIYPTVLDLLGLKAPYKLDGVALK